MEIKEKKLVLTDMIPLYHDVCKLIDYINDYLSSGNLTELFYVSSAREDGAEFNEDRGTLCQFLEDIFIMAGFQTEYMRFFEFIYECYWAKKPIKHEVSTSRFSYFTTYDEDGSVDSEMIDVYTLEFEPHKELEDFSKRWIDILSNIKTFLEHGNVLTQELLLDDTIEGLVVDPNLFNTTDFPTASVAIRDYRIRKLEDQLKNSQTQETEDIETEETPQIKKKGRPSATPVAELFSVVSDLKAELKGKSVEEQKAILQRKVDEGILTEMPKWPALHNGGFITCCKRAWYDGE